MKRWNLTDTSRTWLKELSLAQGAIFKFFVSLLILIVGSDVGLAQGRDDFLNIFQKALKSYYKKNYNKALKNFKKALKIKPESKEILNNIGLCYRGMRKDREAFRWFTKAVRLYPDFRTARINRGIIFAERRRWSMLIKEADELLKRNSQDGLAHFGKGLGLYYKRQFKKAIYHFKRALLFNTNEKLDGIGYEKETKRFIKKAKFKMRTSF